MRRARILSIVHKNANVTRTIRTENETTKRTKSGELSSGGGGEENAAEVFGAGARAPRIHYPTVMRRRPT